MKKKPKRIYCTWCGRYRLGRFMEWHPGCLCWQCKDDSCRAAIDAYEAKNRASRK